ncbi:hypothetical protein R3W88_026911 [Solanum pinnatisectum]|uniref:Polyprotein protein n=1 Tax=Solanum pinnatisectum TaxID=50273 RepID=A0AAV9LEL8_9SOLN|nr:hypothetical protein R3W88_026911 [Solanum pinnatisectum]
MIDAHGFALDALTIRMKACEQNNGVSEDLIALKAGIVGLRLDVDELKSTDLSMPFGIVTRPEVPSTDFSNSFEIPPVTTIGYIARDDVDVESEAETNEKELGVRDAAVYNDLVDLEGAMVQTALEASLRDTSMVGSNGAKDVVDPGTEAQTEGVTDMQSSPQA